MVPVGLTRHRARLAPVRAVGAGLARRVLDLVARAQRRCLARLGTRFVFATDEWYLRAGRPLPAGEAYEGYPQLGNGVGLARHFLDGMAAACRRLPAAVSPPRRAVLPAGTLSAGLVRRAVAPLRRVRGLSLEVVAVPNRLFGPAVGVTGLLAGRDLLAALRGRPRADRVLLAADMLREGGDLFLDGLRPRDLARTLGSRVRAVRAPRDLVRGLLARR